MHFNQIKVEVFIIVTNPPKYGAVKVGHLGNFLNRIFFYLQFYAQTKYVASSFRRKPCHLDIEIDNGNAEAVQDHQMVSEEIANMDAKYMRGVKRKVHQTESEMVRKGKKNEDRRMIEEMVKNVEQLMGLLKENVNDKSEFISFY